jgi:hypothetical protein
MHYARWRRYGDPLTLKKTADGDVQRFFKEVVLTHDGDDCLIWPYSRATSGYPQMRDKGKLRQVSRRVCEHENGPPPSSKHQAAHACGRGHEGCVNRKHLRWATRRENQTDRIKHGNWGWKLPEETVREILSLKGLLPGKEIAAQFGVSRSFVSQLFSGREWKHLTSGQAPNGS